MNKPDVKKLILLNLPYVFAFYFADKIAAVFRLAPGTEFIDKLTNGFAVFGSAFANPLPSFHPVDLLVGLVAGALLKLAVCPIFRKIPASSVPRKDAVFTYLKPKNINLISC